MSARPPLVASDVFEVKTSGTQGAGGSTATKAGNVFFYRRTGGPAAVLTALVTAFRAAVVVPHIAAANARYSVVSIAARPVLDPSSPGVVVADAGVGAIATDGEPSEDNAVVNLGSAYRGKAARGFKHFAGVNEIDTTLDVLTGAGLTRWQAVRDACKLGLTDANGTTYAPFILSRFYSQILVPPTTIYGADITTAKLNLVVASLRKRKSKTTF